MSVRNETIKLDYPIQLADRVVEEVTMRRPTMEILRKNPVKGLGDLAGEMKQLCALTSLRLEEMDLMDSADYTRLQDVYIRFRTPAGRDAHQDSDFGLEPSDALAAVGDSIS